MPESRILMGVVGRPHGVRGLLRVHSYTADPADLPRYAPLQDDAGRVWTLAWRGAGVAELRGADGKPVADRTAAEALVNTRLYVPRERLPKPGRDEFYLADLVGLRAVGADGAALGRVAVVHDYGAGASLEIERSGAAALIVPFTRACVPEVDVSSGQLVVVPPDEVIVPGKAAADVRGDAAADVRGDAAADVRGDAAADVRGDAAADVRGDAAT